ncbi:MAG: DUF131 domain-containing protein [Thaumarchaeota archaeon]|nr:DUF131 domain-containing protein [Nitrososphaerota archaeon]
MSLLELAVGGSLIVLGLLLVFLSLSSLRGEVKGGGVILIGPFPIIIGGSRAVIALLIAFFLIVFLVFAFGFLGAGS